MVKLRSYQILVALGLTLLAASAKAEEFVCAAVVPQCQGNVAILPDRESNPCSVSYDQTCSAIYSSSRKVCQGLRRALENERRKHRPNAIKRAQIAYRECLSKLSANS